MFWIHFSLAELFRDHYKFDKAHAHIECAKSHGVNDVYYLGRVVGLRARVWYEQGKLKEAKFEALRAIDVFEKLGAAVDLENYRKFLRDIEGTMKKPVTSDVLEFDGELPETALLPAPVNSSSLAVSFHKLPTPG